MDRESDRFLWEKIKTEENLVTAIHMMADLGYGMVVSRKRKDEELQEQILVLRKVLLGNGDPANSLVSKVGNLTTSIASICSEIGEIKILLVGDFKSGRPNEALVSRVSLLTTDLGEVSKEVSEIKYFLIGDVSKGADNESILDRIQHSRQATANANRVVWIILTLVITQIILKFIGIL